MERAGEEKKRLRPRLKAARDAAAARAAGTKKSPDPGKAFSDPLFARGGAVMIYVSFGSEVDTRPIIEAATAGRKRGSRFPRCGGEGEMEAAEIQGAFRTFSPDGTDLGTERPAADFIPKEALDLVVVPALAFDREGLPLRLRRGLLRPLSGRPCRPARRDRLPGRCLVPALPREEFDRRGGQDRNRRGGSQH